MINDDKFEVVFLNHMLEELRRHCVSDYLVEVERLEVVSLLFDIVNKNCDTIDYVLLYNKKSVGGAVYCDAGSPVKFAYTILEFDELLTFNEAAFILRRMQESNGYFDLAFSLARYREDYDQEPYNLP